MLLSPWKCVSAACTYVVAERRWLSCTAVDCGGLFQSSRAELRIRGIRKFQIGLPPAHGFVGVGLQRLRDTSWQKVGWLAQQTQKPDEAQQATRKKKLKNGSRLDRGFEPDVNRTRNLLIWSQTRYHCATDPAIPLTRLNSMYRLLASMATPGRGAATTKKTGTRRS